MRTLLFIVIAFFVAVGLDAFDFVGGFVPIFGDIVDAVGIMILFLLIGPIAFVGVVELIPIVITDLFPFYIGIVIGRFLIWLVLKL